MLVLTHGSPDSAAVHRFFHLVHGLGPGTPHRGLVVLGSEFERFGPISGVAFTPEGMCVLAVHEVTSGEGYLFAPLRGGWTIGGRPAYVGGATNPIEAVDRAVKSVVARVRRGGVDPGYVRGLIVVDGVVSGVAQPETDRSAGVLVTAAAQHEVLGALTEGTTQLTGGLKQLWTTADVVETLDALGVPTADLDTESVGAEGFPYSPYVLRPTSIDDIPFARTESRPATGPIPAYERTGPIPSLAEPPLPVLPRDILDLSDPSPRRSPMRWMIPILLLAVLAVAAVLGSRYLFGSDEPAAGPSAGSSDSGPAAGAGPSTPGSQQLGDHHFTQGAYNVTDNCAAYAYGTIKTLLTSTPCTKMERALYLTEVEGKQVVVTLAQVQMPDEASAGELKKTVDTDGTGNVNALLQDGTVPDGYPGADVLDNGQYASSLDGTVVRIVETAYVDGGPATEAIDKAADIALDLVIATS